MTATAAEAPSAAPGTDAPGTDALPRSGDGGIYYRERTTGEVVREPVMAESALRWLYSGGLLSEAVRAVLNKRPFSAVYGIWQRSGFTRGKITGFCRSLGIDPDEALQPLDDFESIDEFFTRRLKPGRRPFDPDPRVFPSPADARVFVFPELGYRDRLPVKGGGYTLGALLASREQAQRYAGGSVAVLRLAPPDYHRFHFPTDGVAGKACVIPGLYDSVNPIALWRSPDLFVRNQRELTEIETEDFGPVAFLEVGATCVGTIVQTYRPGPITRGQEKGYFRFGGSTVVLVFAKGAIRFSDDLLENSAAGLELRVLAGTPLGTRP